MTDKAGHMKVVATGLVFILSIVAFNLYQSYKQSPDAVFLLKNGTSAQNGSDTFYSMSMNDYHRYELQELRSEETEESVESEEETTAPPDRGNKLKKRKPLLRYWNTQFLTASHDVVYNMLITSLFLLFVLTTVSLLIFLLMRRPPCCGPCRDSYQDAHTPSQANGNSSAVPVTYMTESHGIVVKKKILDSPPPYESPPDYQSLAPELIMDAKTLLQLAAASSSSSSSPVASIPPSASATPPPTAAVTPCLPRLHTSADVTTISSTTQETSFLDPPPEERSLVPSEPPRHHQAILPPPTYESVVYIPEDGNRPMAYQTKDHAPSDPVVAKSEMITTIVACDVLTEPPQQQHVEHS